MTNNLKKYYKQSVLAFMMIIAIIISSASILAICSPDWVNCTEWSECSPQNYTFRQCHDASGCLIGDFRTDSDICEYNSTNMTNTSDMNETANITASEETGTAVVVNVTEQIINTTASTETVAVETVTVNTTEEIAAETVDTASPQTNETQNQLTGQAVEDKKLNINWWLTLGVLALIIAIIAIGFFFLSGRTPKDKISDEGWMQK